MRRALESLADRAIEDLRNPRVLLTVIALILAITAAALFIPKTGTVDRSALVHGTAAGNAPPGSGPLAVTRKAPAVGRPVPYGTADPFRTPPKPKPKPKRTSVVTSTSTSESPTSTSPTNVTVITPAQRAFAKLVFSKHATADLAFGFDGEQLTTHRNVPNLTPYPSGGDVVVMFVGVLADADTAVFVPRQGTVVIGKCLPSAKYCGYFELTPGHSKRLIERLPHGRFKEYVIKYLARGRTSHSAAAGGSGGSPTAATTPSSATAPSGNANGSGTAHYGLSTVLRLLSSL